MSLFIRGVVAGVSMVVVAVGIVLAGGPARGEAGVAVSAVVTVVVDPASLPAIDVDRDVYALAGDLDEETVSKIAVTLAENLAIEGEAIRQGNGGLLSGADAGERLTEMQRELDTALATGNRVVTEYRFSTLSVGPADSWGGQGGAALAFHGSGMSDIVSYNPLGQEKSRSTAAFDSIFVLSQIGSDRWLLVSVSSP